MENEIMRNPDMALAQGGMAAFGLLVYLSFYVFYGYCLMLLAKKTNTEDGWMAFVPLLNIYLMLKIGRRQAWELLMFFIPFINFVWIILMIHSVSKRCGKGGGMTALLIFFYPFSFPYLAFSYQQEMAGKPSAQPAQAPI